MSRIFVKNSMKVLSLDVVRDESVGGRCAR